MALLLVLSVIRIAVTTRVQMLVGAATVAVLVIVDVIITAKGGAHGQTLAPFTPSHTATGGFNGVFYGIILGVTSYIGFETAADFGEETKNPRRAIPTAVIVSVLFAIVLYLWTTYSATIGYGIPALSKANNAWVAGGIAGVAQTYAGAVLAKLVTIGALLSAFVVCVGCATASTRTLFAMGRERVFPAWFGRTHPRYLTPMNASITVAVVATAVAAIVGLGFPSDAFGPAFTVYALLATIGTLAIILVYIALCLGGMVFLRRTSRRFNPLLHGVVPLIGVVIFVAAWYGSFRTATGVLEVAPYVAAAWFIVGIGVLAYLVRRRSEAVDRIGSILGEEGGESATGLDAEPTA
jgi:amino acid transporter